jgi:hypothetical protein
VTTVAEPVRHWYRDTVSCLQATFASLLQHRGADPLDVLGLAWQFRHLPGDVRAEEFYWPCQYPGDLARSIMPYHQVTSRWRDAGDDPYADLAEVLADGRLPVVAVDNFHLPFRPAWHDVHSAHLIVVAALDDGRAWISDAMPPAFQGWLDRADLDRAWGSANPRDHQNVFFGGAPIGGRWLDVELTGPFPAVDPARLGTAVAANVEALTGPGTDGPAQIGLTGLRRYLAALIEAAGNGRSAELEAAYTFGWGNQAQTSLHGELLRRCGSRWREPAAVRAGRAVERVCHLWTGIRLGAAYGRADPPAAVTQLIRHADRLCHGYEDALAALDRMTARL